MYKKEVVEAGVHVAHPDRVSLCVPARAEFVAICRLAVSGLSYACRLDEETTGDLKLAVTEACAHAIESVPGQHSELRVDFEVMPEMWIVDVWVCEAGTDVAYPLLDFAPQDLGLLIMRAVLDEVSLVDLGDRGRLLRLRKHI